MIVKPNDTIESVTFYAEKLADLDDILNWLHSNCDSHFWYEIFEYSIEAFEFKPGLKIYFDNNDDKVKFIMTWK